MRLRPPRRTRSRWAPSPRPLPCRRRARRARAARSRDAPTGRPVARTSAPRRPAPSPPCRVWRGRGRPSPSKRHPPRHPDTRTAGPLLAARYCAAVDDGGLVPDPDGLELDGLTLLLQRLARDQHELIDGLARSIGGALPDAVRVKRRGLFNRGRAHSLEIHLGDEVFE